MFKESDIQFHTPSPVTYDWAETGYFNFYIPEANLLGLIYIVHRPGIGATVADIQIVDRWSTRIEDTAYVDQSQHNPLPDNAVNFSLPNGLTYRALSLSQYQLEYKSADAEIKLHCSALMEPFDIHDPDMDPMASVEAADDPETTGFGAAYSAHFDMTIKVSGSLRLGNQQYDIDCISTMDHSWGPRPETDLGYLLWINAHLDEDNFLHALFSYDPYAPEGEQHTFRHGYVKKDGKLLGLIAAEVSAKRDSYHVISASISVTDLNKNVYTYNGVALNHHPWLPYGNCLSPISLMRWHNADGQEGYGTFLEGFPINNRLRRS